MTERLLRARDVAEMLDLEVGTVVDHFQRGDLPGFRLYGRRGGPLRFRASEIEAWLEEKCRPTLLQSADRQKRDGGARRTPSRGTGGKSLATGILRPVRE